MSFADDIISWLLSSDFSMVDICVTSDLTFDMTQNAVLLSLH